MGLFDFIKGEFIEVIDWVEKDRDTVLWKFPDRDANIKYGAQLTVRESQTAIFIDEGRIADLFEPGRFELITQNLPVLTSLRSWDKGFKSPFKCDVYFLSTRIFPDLKWGTPNPVIMRDPEFKQVRVKAFGVYFVRIADPEKFFLEFAGTQEVLKIQELEEKLRNIVSPKFAEALVESGVSVMDLVGQYTELGDKIAPLLQKDLDPFGIELTRFQITSTSLPKEVEEFYDKMTNMNMVGDMRKFTEFQSANAIEKAAENPGGGAGEGIGMGMGFGMAQMMMNQQKQSSEQPSSKAQTREEVLATLKELGTLKESGILTEEEFEQKKKELLGRL
ncbi:MAG: SPFH domain-containing protein [Saprospiraceae bacterium]|nr:SPFH domain-containing protein [Saprospiraceae bacterium]MCB0624711.1 SPFH domain-containing protein [Saprospiraceae bacterium]MCB0678721.1 SPFH domain-containing protein [Saprospiraceae bacterium]MCB0679993.1 SPFH domain-containing protein [Saprospiraceae bacterium]